MIEQIVSDKEILLEKYPSYADKNIKVVEKPKIEILEQAYTECRYPVPVPISRYYKITKDGSMGQYPFDSSDLEKFAFKMGNTIIQRIEEDYSLSIKRESPISPINETSWEVFSSLFFKRHRITEIRNFLGSYCKRNKEIYILLENVIPTKVGIREINEKHRFLLLQK